MIYGFSLHYKCFLDLQLTRYAVLLRVRENDLQLTYPMPSSVQQQQQQWGQHCVELWLFGYKKEGNFLALDFRSKIPYMFLQLHLILMPVNTHRDRQMDAACCSSSTHPEENCNRSKCCLQIPFFCMPLLYTPPTHTHKAMFHGWMDSPPFYRPTTRVQRGVANTWKCAG